MTAFISAPLFLSDDFGNSMSRRGRKYFARAAALRPCKVETLLL
jgi:hypothetical protein